MVNLRHSHKHRLEASANQGTDPKPRCPFEEGVWKLWHNANSKLCAHRRYEAEQEEAMEEAYQSYLERQGQRAQAARAKRARLGKTGDLGSDEEAADDAEPAPVPELRVSSPPLKPKP